AGRGGSPARPGRPNPTTEGGIDIDDAGFLTAPNNVVEGNSIGPDITGTHALGNVAGGVVVITPTAGSTGNVIGGSTPGAGNLISGNSGPHAQAGIWIHNSHGVTIQGNRIGTDATGTSGLPHSTGIMLDFGT